MPYEVWKTDGLMRRTTRLSSLTDDKEQAIAKADVVAQRDTTGVGGVVVIDVETGQEIYRRNLLVENLKNKDPRA